MLGGVDGLIEGGAEVDLRDQVVNSVESDRVVETAQHQLGGHVVPTEPDLLLDPLLLIDGDSLFPTMDFYRQQKL